MQVQIIDAFTQTPGQGNRAGVMLDASSLDVPTMQRIAAVVGASETAFVLSRPEDPTVRLRYFTPVDEIPFCGHATVATFHLLAEKGLLRSPGTYRLECPAGMFDIELEPRGPRGTQVWIVTPQPAAQPSPVSLEALMPLLGGTVAQVDTGLPVIRQGHRLVVPLRRREDLEALAPRGAAMNALLMPHGVRGVYLFTRDAKEEGSVAQARYFVPGFGILEDPVTGSAAGPLAAYLAEHGVLRLPEQGGTVSSRIEQGDTLGKPGRIDIEVTGRPGRIERARVGGVALTVMEATIVA
ncbi:PhzF family phenazine biosynthesis protein [Corallococcus praedator]|uniref:PhzF family phenazine biosynthesis protein n=1 Tax=Corallococcus praedator TaxID=2316724 RepID=A0ABX9QQ89_9BACT|nr:MULTISPECIES: PhzF family phenazine biosynthesis protein [Corallococcus]RKH17873.1 PhzF family phenazine biosynthesis protein [Corallococcus sp. CA047B]RKH35269.1 PhzF family phenazine biosynthesis protein [Corallococcus sp. CA031C]RKI16399.1 PhzF family phenazine biosynthesis protein [Corallococcus praedator]